MSDNTVAWQHTYTSLALPFQIHLQRQISILLFIQLKAHLCPCNTLRRALLSLTSSASPRARYTP